MGKLKHAPPSGLTSSVVGHALACPPMVRAEIGSSHFLLAVLRHRETSGVRRLISTIFAAKARCESATQFLPGRGKWAEPFLASTATLSPIQCVLVRAAGVGQTSVCGGLQPNRS